MDSKRAKETKTESWVNKTALILLMVLGSVIGFLPIIVFLEKPLYLLLIAVATTLVALLEARKLPETAANSPSLLEFLLGGIGSIYLPAFFSGFSFLVYLVIYGVAALIRFLLIQFDVSTGLDPQYLAQTPTAVFSVILAFLHGFDIQHLYNQLYSQIAGLKSVFYDTISRQKGRTIGCFVLAIVVLGAFLALFLAKGWTGGWFFFLLTGLLAGISAPLYVLEEASTRSTSEVETIQELFKAVGYTVVSSLQTGNSAIDPLLVTIDLLAYDEERAFAVQITSGNAERPTPRSHESTGPAQRPASVDWTVASTLQTAIWKLIDAGHQFGLTDQPVEPMLILVDMVPDKSLLAFLSTEQIQIKQLDSETIARASSASKEEREEIAEQYLGLTPGQRHPGLSIDVTEEGEN